MHDAVLHRTIPAVLCVHAKHARVVRAYTNILSLQCVQLDLFPLSITTIYDIQLDCCKEMLTSVTFMSLWDFQHIAVTFKHFSQY